MAENKKYYFLKLKEDFFERREIVVLEGTKDGILYVNILLKLYLKSLQHNGKLLLNNGIPLSAEMIAMLTRHEIGTVERALQVFLRLGLAEILEDNTYYLPEILNMTGKGSSEGERKAEYRKVKTDSQKQSLLSKKEDLGQVWDNVPRLSPICPPEIRDQRLEEEGGETRTKTIPKQPEEKKSYGSYQNVFLTDAQYQSLVLEYPAEYKQMVEHLSEYMESSGRNYKNHFLTMKRWKTEDRERREEKFSNKAENAGYLYNGEFKEGESL